MATELLRSMFASSTSEDYLLTDDGSCSEIVESSDDEESYAMMNIVAEQPLGLGLRPENTISVSSNAYQGNGNACGLEEIEVVDALVTHEDGGAVGIVNPEYFDPMGNYGPGISLLDNDDDEEEDEEGGESMRPDTVAENTALEVSYQKHAWPCDPTASAYSPTQSDVVTSATNTALFKNSHRSFDTDVEEPSKPLHPNTAERGRDDTNARNAPFSFSPSRTFDTTSTMSMTSEIVPWPGTEPEEDCSPSRRTLVQMSGRGNSPASGSHGGTDASSQFSEPDFTTLTNRGFISETSNSMCVTPSPPLQDPPAVQLMITRLMVAPDASPSSTRENTVDSVEPSSPVASSENRQDKLSHQSVNHLTDSGISRVSRKFNSTGRNIADGSSNNTYVPQIQEVEELSSPRKENANGKTNNRVMRFKQRRKLFSGSQDQLHRQSLETEDESQLKETQSSTIDPIHQDVVGAQVSKESSPILPSPVITEVGEGYHERRKVFFSSMRSSEENNKVTLAPAGSPKTTKLIEPQASLQPSTGIDQPVIPSIVTPERMSVDLFEREPAVQQSEEEHVKSPAPDTNIDLSMDEDQIVSAHLSLVRRLRYNRKKKLQHIEQKVPTCPVTPTRDMNRSPSRDDALLIPPLHHSSSDRRHLVPPESPGVSSSLNGDAESRISSLLGTEYVAPQGADYSLSIPPLHHSSPDRLQLVPPESPGVSSSLNGDTESRISSLLGAEYVSPEGVDILHDLWSIEYGLDSAQIYDDDDDDDVLTRMMMTVAGVDCTNNAMLLQQCVIEPCTSQIQAQIKAQWLRESATTRPLNDDYGPEHKKLSSVKKSSKRKKKSKSPTHSPRVAELFPASDQSEARSTVSYTPSVTTTVCYDDTAYFDVIVHMQARARRLIAQNHYRELRLSTLYIQTIVRGFLCRHRYDTAQEAAYIIQYYFRNFLTSRRDKKTRKQVRWKDQETDIDFSASKQIRIVLHLIVRTQARARQVIAHRRFQEIWFSTLYIQMVARGFICRQRYSYMKGAVVKLQSICRMFIASRRSESLKRQICSSRSEDEKESEAGNTEYAFKSDELALEFHIDEEIVSADVVDSNPEDIAASEPGDFIEKETSMEDPPGYYPFGDSLLSSDKQSVSPASLFDEDDDFGQVSEKWAKHHGSLFASKESMEDNDNKWVDPETFPRSWKMLRFDPPPTTALFSSRSSPPPMMESPTRLIRTRERSTNLDLNEKRTEEKIGWETELDSDEDNDDMGVDDGDATGLLSKRSGRLSRIRHRLTVSKTKMSLSDAGSSSEKNASSCSPPSAEISRKEPVSIPYVTPVTGVTSSYSAPPNDWEVKNHKGTVNIPFVTPLPGMMSRYSDSSDQLSRYSAPPNKLEVKNPKETINIPFVTPLPGMMSRYSAESSDIDVREETKCDMPIIPNVKKLGNERAKRMLTRFDMSSSSTGQLAPSPHDSKKVMWNESDMSTTTTSIKQTIQDSCCIQIQALPSDLQEHVVSSETRTEPYDDPSIANSLVSNASTASIDFLKQERRDFDMEEFF